MDSAKIQMSRVGRKLLKIALVRLSSKRTLAATWKMTETLSINNCLSFGDNPKPSAVTSPLMGISLSKMDGRWLRNVSKN